MDRRTTIGYILILGLFVAYLLVNKNTLDEIEKQQEREVRDSITGLDSQAPSIVAEIPDDTTSSQPDLPEEDSEIKPQIILKTYVLENDKIKVEFSNLGGVPVQVQLKKFKRYDSTELILFNRESSQFSYFIPLADGTLISTSELEFKNKTAQSEKLELFADLGNGAGIMQTYSFSQENSYLLDYHLEFIGLSEIMASNNLYIQLDWKTQIKLQEKDLDDERNNTAIYYKYASESDVENLKETSDDDEKLSNGIEWIAFKQKFFNYTLISRQGFDEGDIEISTVEPETDDFVEELKTTMYLPVERGSEQSFDLQLYAGPNHYQSLKKLDLEMQQMIPLGWGIFGWVNKFLVIPVFNWLSQYFSNYGIIILFLTLIIKVLLFMPMFKVYKSSAKLKLLKPELDEIKERTGGDMQKMQSEQMKLYKQAGVSPLGGCLPQLVQLPILFAMFRFFPSSIELRQQSLWWADDLSSFDSIWDFPGGFSIPGYGDHISLFTLLMTGVTLLYTFMNSQTSAGLTGPMKWVMYLMPVMFLGIFNNYASALSFYYFLATSITIVQNFVIRKFFIDEDKLHKQIQANKKKKVSVKKSRLQKRLEDMAKKRGVDPYKRPSGKKR